MLAIALIVFVVLKGCENTARAPFEVVRDALRSFEHNVTLSIRDSITSVRGTDGDELVLAELQLSEDFRETDVWCTPAGIPFLGKTEIPGTKRVSEIRVPATFRYYVKLSEPVSVKIIQSTDSCVCIVTAPALRPYLPPAIDTSQMDFYVDAGLFRSTDDEAFKKIVTGITPQLNLRAVEHEKLVRDQARKAFAKFVRLRLLKDEFYGKDDFNEIVVKFADET